MVVDIKYIAITLTSFLCVSKITCNPYEFELHDEEDQPYTNEWAARIFGGPDVVELVAREHGYTNVGQLVGVPDTYLLKKEELPKKSQIPSFFHSHKLNNDDRVDFAEQQQIIQREKREKVLLELLKEISFNDKCTNPNFSDPQWQDQWYMCDSRSDPSLHAVDLHVDGVWKAGITGKGVVLCIPDDGLEWNHTDIYQNYDPIASWDANDNDSDPFPRYEPTNKNTHGTRCAGEIAMVANNSKCGVGIAYNAKIGGVRILDGRVTDSLEAIAIGYMCNHTDIYSASWGPPDNGRSLDGPRHFTGRSMRRCIKEGRGGKGTIYVWASGNGGDIGDNCNYDGYVNSIYTVSIGGAEPNGDFPSYAEMCAAIIASTYVGEYIKNQYIVTIDVHNGCAAGHTGTSAAAPLGAGIIALMLEANGDLTWRDVQHIIIRTSDNSSLLNNPGWYTNAAGLSFNIRFGFGTMHAEKAVALAKKWKPVPSQLLCNVNPLNFTAQIPLSSSSFVQVIYNATNCTGTREEHVKYIEHVQVRFHIRYTRRGALNMDLISPHGTRSTLLLPREHDNSTRGFKKWTAMSLHLWGESPEGLWRLIISDNTTEANTGYVGGAVLKIRGTSDMPQLTQ